MSHPEAQLARDLLPAAEHRRPRPDDGLETLRGDFREIGGIETLTPEQEVALAKAVEGYTRGMRQELLGIPLTARLLVGRWCELRSANRSTAALRAPSPDGQTPDASARMEDALQRVSVRGVLADRGMHKRKCFVASCCESLKKPLLFPKLQSLFSTIHPFDAITYFRSDVSE